MPNLKECVENAVARKSDRVERSLEDAEKELESALSRVKALRAKVAEGEYVHTTMGREAPNVAESLNNVALRLTSSVNQHNMTVVMRDTLEDSEKE